MKEAALVYLVAVAAGVAAILCAAWGLAAFACWAMDRAITKLTRWMK